MNNEEENNKEINHLKNAIREMMAVTYMCENAPRDDKGNVVVDLVGIKNFGLFYLYKN